MATSEQVEAKTRDKIIKQIDLEISKISKEIAGGDKDWLSRSRAFGRFLLSHIATITIVVTAALAILSYRAGTSEQKRQTFSNLVDRLVAHSAYSQYNEFISMATISAIRSEYASNEDYASEVAFVVMPYVFRDKSQEELRLYAARVLSEAISNITDYEEYWRIYNIWRVRVDEFVKNSEDVTQLVASYSAANTCIFQVLARDRFGRASDLDWCSEQVEKNDILHTFPILEERFLQ